MVVQARPNPSSSAYPKEPSLSLSTTSSMERRHCSSSSFRGRRRTRRRPSSSLYSSSSSSSSSSSTFTPRRIFLVSPATGSSSAILLVSLATTLVLQGRHFVVVANDSDHYFCGSSWGDASNNCDDRQPCPSGSDEDCTLSGGTCWADTLCDVSLGHGSKFKVQQLLDVPYDDLSNRYFCGVWLAKAMENCSLETHCATSDDCGMGETCWETTCNVQDFVSENIEMALTEEEKKESGKLAPDDERRHNYCGISWVDASAECAAPCLGGEDTECPTGLTCFGDTTCYNDQDLVPTLTPTTSQPTVPPTPSPMEPTLSPTTYPPTELRLNVDMTKFCGTTWSDAIDNCSTKTHCDRDSDCADNETCFEDLPGCNLVDLKEKQDANGSNEETTGPDRNDISQSRFCGVDWADAIDNCTLERHCPLGTDDECPSGERCYSYLSAKCNAYDMMGLGTPNPTTTSPTFQPTERPSVYYSPYPTVTPTTAAPSTLSPSILISQQTLPNRPTAAPTQPFVWNSDEDNPANLWCGYNQLNANKNCGSGIPCPNADCPNGLECYIVLQENCYAGIYGTEKTVAPTMVPPTRAPMASPTKSPTLTPISALPTKSPTKSPSSTPTLSPDSAADVTNSPTDVRELSPTSSQNPSQRPSDSPIVIMTRSPTIIVHKNMTSTEQDSLAVAESANLESNAPSMTPTSNSAEVRLPQLYCSYTYQELATTCSTAPSCQNTPCPSGQYCFSYTCDSTPSVLDDPDTTTVTTNITTSTIPAVEVAETESLEADDATVETEPTLAGTLAVEREESTQEESQQVQQQIQQQVEEDIVEEDGEEPEKFYCAPLVLTDFDMYCGSAAFCNDDNPCPDGQYCIPFECDQPERRYDYCPWGYSGWYFSQNCQKYYECSSGEAGESYVCDEGLLFDRVQRECVHRSMVNRFCNGPPLEEGNTPSKYQEAPMRAPPAPVIGTTSPPPPGGVGYNDTRSDSSSMDLDHLPALEGDDKRFADGGENENATTFADESSTLAQATDATVETTTSKYEGMDSWEDWEDYWQNSSSALWTKGYFRLLLLSSQVWSLFALIII